jgi:hypothetical protein
MEAKHDVESWSGAWTACAFDLISVERGTLRFPYELYIHDIEAHLEET